LLLQDLKTTLRLKTLPSPSSNGRIEKTVSLGRQMAITVS